MTTRRQFLKTAAAASTVFAPFVIHAADKAGTKRAVVGEGEHTYECIHDWGMDNLPSAHSYGNATHVVTIDSQGMIYVTHHGGPGSIFVFDPDGKFVRSMGDFHRTNTGRGHGIDIRKEDLRVDTFRSSGAGGQHVNTTDSAVRLTHLPTGIVVECQDERSQHKNRARAMSLLQAKLLSAEQESQRASQASERRSLVGSGDRSERIRTYNFPQGRITDHRINLTLYKLDEVVSGDLDPLILPLRQEHQADLLAAMAEE